MLPRTPCALNYAVVIITQSVAICLCEPSMDASVDKQLIRALAEDNWFGRLAINLLSYSVILIPSALIVFMVKNRLCVQSVSDNYLVKLFVFGKHDTILDNGYHNSGSDFSDNEKLLPITVNDTADGKQLSPKSSSASSSPIRTRRITLLLYCFLGLQISYLSWGLLQEKIMTTEYVIRSEFFAEGLHNRHFTAVAERLAPVPAPGDIQVPNGGHNGDTPDTYRIKFRNSQFLVLVNRILAFLIAFVALQISNRRDTRPARPVAKCEPPLHQYIYCSLSNILSSWCQYEALKFVSFPTQVLSKACKIMPVMLMSQVIGGKKYRTVEYLFAISISIGMTIFLWNDHSVNGSSSHHHKLGADSADSSSSGHYYGGLAILALYLTFDSFTSNWQTVLFDRYKMSTLHMMAAVNFFSILLTSTSLVEQGDLAPAFRMVAHNGDLLADCVLLSVFSAAGQLFVFYTISTFGALVFVTIMTLRQAVAILLSCLVYDHALGAWGSLGIVVVFATLFAQIYWKSRSKR